MEQDYLGKCNELLERLNQAEVRLLENVAKLSEREEVSDGSGKEKIGHLMEKI